MIFEKGTTSKLSVPVLITSPDLDKGLTFIWSIPFNAQMVLLERTHTSTNINQSCKIVYHNLDEYFCLKAIHSPSYRFFRLSQNQ